MRGSRIFFSGEGYLCLPYGGPRSKKFEFSTTSPPPNPRMILINPFPYTCILKKSKYHHYNELIGSNYITSM